MQAYNKVLDQYPGGNKTAAAQLKKAYALLELGQRDAGVQELRSLISRYPKSPEALQARDRLTKLGAAGRSLQETRPPFAQPPLDRKDRFFLEHSSQAVRDLLRLHLPLVADDHSTQYVRREARSL